MDETRTTVVSTFQRRWIKSYIDFTRALGRDVIARAEPEARRIFGFPSRSPHTERWQWDEEAGRPAGRPLERYRAELAEQLGYGDCCL